MKLPLNKIFAIAALSGFLAAPALAQMTPAQTNLDPAAASMEARNARGAELTDVSPEQARANELRRCDRLPEFYKSDCVARIENRNVDINSVVGGGDFQESITTMPQSELERLRANTGAVQIPGSTR